ncbi:MAG: M23 family metallopeptidase [Bacteroidetes bacterium]|nr:M23 family metallopeptidase [Bacteroidota bacterium]MBP8752786.1 M23 family metallopeptidase [Chitinophagales bacterium]MBK7108930.1 M23 family metallopeptidase [Bacteroidota bacterium]MBK8488743.1 M23 family metallopeptidase [Bacteroidota bacterium]MBK8681500.1 M23 family metallopeptidase [Bacteroidota bacterium]
MGKTSTGRKSWFQQLRNKYRLVLMHDKTFEVRTSVTLTTWNVIIILSTVFVVLTALVYSILVFTPLKNYVVGYSEYNTMRQIVSNSSTTDSMLLQLKAYDIYFENLQRRLNGELDSAQFALIMDSTKDYTAIDITTISDLDKQLRNDVEKEDLFNLSANTGSGTSKENFRSLLFFPPLKGTITSEFNVSEGHFGIDIVAKENTPIKCCLDGVVIAAFWSLQAGNVIIVQHDHGLISQYKHNSQLLRKEGDAVKAGDVLAIIGNTGELSSGPHLHFELWHEKIAMNPAEFIIFN